MDDVNAALAAARKPVSRGNAAEQVFDDLRDSILRGALARGARLPSEKQLADTYGVSGPTIREAIRGLIAAQLVDVRHGSGTYVTADADRLLAVSLNAMMRMESVGVAELLDVLSALHAHAAERSALLATDEHIERMAAALALIERAAHADDVPRALRQFLGAIVDSSGNPLLATLCRFLTDLQVELTGELSGGSLEGWQATASPMTAHRQALLDAIRARDPAAARSAAEAYHRRSIEIIGALPRLGAARKADPGLSKLLGALLQRRA